MEMLGGLCENRKPSGHSRKIGLVCDEYKKIDLSVQKENDDKSILRKLNKIYLELEEIKHFVKD